MASMNELKQGMPRWMKSSANLVTRDYAQLTGRSRPTPDFLIIGSKRGGTTSLYNYLLMHPGVCGLFPQIRGRKSTDYFYKEHGRGDRWYKSHFHTEGYRKLMQLKLGYRPVSGEASPYYQWDPRVAPLVFEMNPGIKAIALLRNPTERAWSHYQERVHNGVEPLGFEAALEAEEQRLEGEMEKMLADPGYYSSAHDFYSYRSRGIYLPQIQNWHKSFPSSQLLVLRSEDMYQDVRGAFNMVSDFLGIPQHKLPDTSVYNAITTSEIPPASRDLLMEFYAPHNAALACYLEREPLW